MVNRKNLFLFFAAFLFSFGSLGLVYAMPVTLETSVSALPDGTLQYKPLTGSSATWANPNLTMNYPAPVTTSKGVVSVALSRVSKADLSRVGAGVVSFAKFAGPVGMGIQAVTLMCSISGLCDNGQGVWQKAADPAIAGWPTTHSFSTGIWYAFGQFSPSTYPEWGFPDADKACRNWISYKATSAGSNPPLTYYDNAVVNSTSTTCRWTNSLSQLLSQSISTSANTCASGYSKGAAGICNLNGNPVAHVPSADEWNAAIPKLNVPEMVSFLITGGQPIPVYQPGVVSTPITQEIGRTDITNPDGTRTETITNLTTTDNSTTSNVNNYTVVENTTVNNYNTSNQLVTTTTTTAEPPAQPVTSTGMDTSTLAKESTLQDVRTALVSPVMPDLFPTTTGGNTALDTASALVSNLITDQAVTNKKTDLGWSFLPQLPTGSCATVPFGVRTWLVNYDWCTDLGKARTMWGWLFAMLGALYIWRRGTAALSGQS